MLLGFLIKMTSAISLVEILFKNNIKDARCQSQCLDVETPEEKVRCVSICRELEARPQDDDLCSLPSVCTGGCLVACEARTASSIGVKITEARMETCDLSWDLASDTEEDVVFVVAGRDKAGMWSLITDSLTLASLELSTGLADRMEEVVVLAVSRVGLEDSVRLDVSSNKCLETIPSPREWREREEQAEDREARIQESTNIVTAVVLALVGVCGLLLSVASILVRLRARSGVEDVEVRGQEEDLELPYSPPVKGPLALVEEQSETLKESHKPIVSPSKSKLEEEDDYEEVDLAKVQTESIDVPGYNKE